MDPWKPLAGCPEGWQMREGAKEQEACGRACSEEHFERSVLLFDGSPPDGFPGSLRMVCFLGGNVCLVTERSQALKALPEHALMERDRANKPEVLPPGAGPEAPQICCSQSAPSHVVSLQEKGEAVVGWGRCPGLET